MAIPGSAIRITLKISQLLKGFTLVMSALEELNFLKMLLISALSSTVSPWLSLWQARLTAVIYFPLGGHCGAMAKLVPWASMSFWTSVKAYRRGSSPII